MRRWTLLAAAIGAALGLLVVPVVASHNFTDVPDSSVFHADIEWLADTGITKGCNPNDNPPNTQFCPKDKVSREQMAAFLRRFADNLLGGIALSELPDKLITATGLQQIGAVTITARQPGHVVVTATGWTDGTTTDDTLLSVGLNVSETANGLDLQGPDGILIHGSSSFFPDPNEIAPYEFRYPFAVTRYFDVETPGTYTYYLFAEAVIQDDGDLVDELDVTVNVPVLQATFHSQAVGAVPAP